MRHLTLLGTLFITATVAACGGSGSYYGGGSAKSSPEPAAPATEASGEDGAGWFDDGAPPPPGAQQAPSADRSAGAEGDAEEAAPVEKRRSRPGLGTSWGETRVSRVSTAPFFRADPDGPLAVARMFYNDREGVRAMSGKRFVSHDQSVSSLMGGGLTVTLIDSSGRPLQGVQSGSSTYVVGQHGQRYQIRIRNHTNNRVEAVATVDGLDVIDGREGSFTKRGYIINPFATVEIDGFRTSHDTVAAFRFGSVDSSYASRKGKGRNVGVIGVAFFEERGAPWQWNPREVRRRHNADPFPGRFATPPGGGWHD